MDTIIVCNNKTKEKILEDLNSKPIINIKFMDKREFIHNYYFDYNKKTIYYLMNTYHYKYDIALEYLNNLYYIEDKKYNNYKLNMLVELKKELDDNNLLIYNKLFIKYLTGKKIKFIGYLTKYDLRMIESLKDICEIEIEEEEVNNYQPKVYSFKTIDEEVEFVAHQICKLIDNGINPQDIKIANVSSDYTSIISRIFKMYHLNIQEKKCLFGMNITKAFIDNYDSNINKTIELLKSKYDNTLVNKIINIVNQYNFIDDYRKVKDLILEDIRRTYIKTNYNDQIEIIDYHDTYNDKYIFLMNFNEESIPKKYQDIDFINDSIKPSYLENTNEKNSIEKSALKSFIRNTNNLIITYKLKTPFSNFYPSSMIEALNLNVEEGIINKKNSYSKSMGIINTCKMLDDYYKYGIKHEDIGLYYHNYSIDYNTYSNKYHKIENYDEPLVLSYTSMDNYYKCSFKYYLNKVLKVDKPDDNTSKYIGSIFHYVLEKGLYDDVDYQSLVNEYLIHDNISLTLKESFFLNKLVKEIPNIINEIRKQDEFIKLKNRLYEEKVFVEFGDSKFMGVIDKVMYDGDKYAIIDYKTGKTDINLKLMRYGLNMQLPVYLYLAHKKFGGHVVGFYLNQILHGNIKYDPKKDYDKQYKDNLKLYGYSNTKYISDFDTSYGDSQIIKSLKTKNDGNFYSYSKVLSNDEMEDMVELVEDKIINCIDSIKDAEFDINPKTIDGKNVSCEYCKYSDICFKTNDDIVILKEDYDA